MSIIVNKSISLSGLDYWLNKSLGIHDLSNIKDEGKEETLDQLFSFDNSLFLADQPKYLMKNQGLTVVQSQLKRILPFNT